MQETVNYKAFGKRIRNKRKAMGLTQADLASASGLSVSFLGHIERGSRKASLETLLNICKALSVMPNDLLRDSIDSVGYPRRTAIESENVFKSIRELIDKIESQCHNPPTSN